MSLAARARLPAETRGLWLGLLGVAIFAMTLPMTRLAVGAGRRRRSCRRCSSPPAARRWPALLSIAYLRLTGAAAAAARGCGRRWALCAAGTVIGFPLFLALALRHVDAMHAAVVTGLLPLATAAIAALVAAPAAVARLLGLRRRRLRAGAGLRGLRRRRPPERGRRPAAAGGR